jgi:hypothetical protein
MRRAIFLLSLLLLLAACITKGGSINLPRCMLLCRATVVSQPAQPQPSLAPDAAPGDMPT